MDRKALWQSTGRMQLKCAHYRKLSGKLQEDMTQKFPLTFRLGSGRGATGRMYTK